MALAINGDSGSIAECSYPKQTCIVTHMAPPACADWDGGLVLVSHDFRLIGQVCNEIWEVKGGAVTRWKGDIVGYKEHLRKTHDALLNRKDLG